MNGFLIKEIYLINKDRLEIKVPFILKNLLFNSVLDASTACALHLKIENNDKLELLILNCETGTVYRLTTTMNTRTTYKNGKRVNYEQ